ncbi:MAG: hypothetical protein IJR63_03290 [Synergistaceae bacterium]|nr:hypothetical protein [Synergistaceae bacterium]
MRLNTLLETFRSRKYVSRNELLTSCGYNSGRTLEGDIRFLREAFCAEIHFSRRAMGYVLDDVGRYILDGAKHA